VRSELQQSSKKVLYMNRSKISEFRLTVQISEEKISSLTIKTYRSFYV